MVQAGVYSSVFHYLKAVHEMKSDADGAAVVAKMKATPTDDALFGKGSIRADGRKIHDMYLFEVKKPDESKGPWDYYKVRATIPAAEAFRPVDRGRLPAREVAVSIMEAALARRLFRLQTGDDSCLNSSACRPRHCSASCCSASSTVPSTRC